MIRMSSIVITFILLICTHAHACLWDHHRGADFNPRNSYYTNHGYRHPGFDGFGSLFGDTFYTGDEIQDDWWGQSGDTFNVVLTYSNTNIRQELGYMQNGSYYTLLEAVDIGGRGIQRHENVTIDLSNPNQDDPFMWVDMAGNGPSGAMIFSDADFNFGQRDLFRTYELADDMWLIAFGSGDSRHRWGGYPGLMAVVTRSVSGTEPLPTPVPASVILLASGCTGLLLKRRKV